MGLILLRVIMILNLTERDVPGSVSMEGTDEICLMDALHNSHLDESVAILMEYDPTIVIVDIDEDFFNELRDNMPSVELIMGARGLNYEST